MRELAVIIPVYNEELAIEGVIQDWTQHLSALKIDYTVFILNDGSRDRTEEVCRKICARNPRIVLKNKPNSGHGPTILQGYCATCHEYAWIFQVDSDNEMAACHFAQIWQQRENYDFIIGRRSFRQQALSRRVLSSASRTVARILAGAAVWDVNSPYRLMRSKSFCEFYTLIPPDTFAPNVIISALTGLARLRCLELPVPHQGRQTGEVSIQKWKLARAAALSFVQTVRTLLALRGHIRQSYGRGIQGG